ncbi:alpha/beta hydrolase [Nonomuraea sp. NPDC026600]|uniref:alpha/beta fold hydrolase n=1 Tax=Nonomuraea sp. NPDC026600 TaxID=3155363 RepID=UPI0033C031F9
MTDTTTSALDWTYRREAERLKVYDLEVAVRRDGDGETLLFLHGVGFTRQWLPLYATLAKTLNVVAPEHPGFGDTTLPAYYRDFTDYVQHYDAFIAALGEGSESKKIHLAGHGLGARLAAHLATYYPSRFSSLTLIAPSGLRADDEPLIDLFRKSAEDLHAAEFNGRQDQFKEAFELKGFPEDTLDSYRDSTAHALMTWTNRFDVQLPHRLGRVAVPTLVIAPEEDQIGGRSAAARYAELIPGAHLEKLAGPNGEPSSYAMTIEQPVEVAALITAHVAACQEK